MAVIGSNLRRWFARAVIPKSPRESSSRYKVPHQGAAEKARRARRAARLVKTKDCAK